jgi:broad specificity phosphatase PhoE
MRFGSFEGLAIRGPEVMQTIEQLKTLKEKMKRDANARCPGGGESTAEVETRSKQGLSKVLQEISEEQRHIVIVAHGRTNKVLLCCFYLATL